MGGVSISPTWSAAVVVIAALSTRFELLSIRTKRPRAHGHPVSHRRPDRALSPSGASSASAARDRFRRWPHFGCRPLLGAGLVVDRDRTGARVARTPTGVRDSPRPDSVHPWGSG